MLFLFFSGTIRYNILSIFSLLDQCSGLSANQKRNGESQTKNAILIEKIFEKKTYQLIRCFGETAYGDVGAAHLPTPGRWPRATGWLAVRS